MISSQRFSLIFLLATGLAAPLGAEDIALNALTIDGTLANNLRVTAQPVHAAGPTAIKLLAVEVFNADQSWSVPNLNDSGVEGDDIAGDGVWSKTMVLNGAAPGDYDVITYVVDTNGEELVTDPQSFTIN